MMANNFKQGWSVIGGKKYYFRSGFEVRWAQYLELLKGLGEIADWEYEPQLFYFNGVRKGTVSYRPDFKVYYSGVIIPTDKNPYAKNCFWHEVKGFLQQKDVTKFRRMAKYHPDEKIILVMQNIPQKPTKKNAEKLRRLANARKYVERIMEAEKLLKQVGL